MPLNNQDPIAPGQSATIQAAIKIVVLNVSALLATVGISSESIQLFDRYGNLVVAIIPFAINIYLAFRVIKHRINATETIQKKEK